MKKPILILFCIATLSRPAFSQSGVPLSMVATFRNLSEDERASLSRGEAVFRQPEGWKDLSVPAAAPFYRETEDAVRKGGYNYLGEVLLMMRRAEGDAAIPAMTARLRDVERYAGIPYWSTRQQTWYDLFDWVRVVSGTRTESLGSLEARQFMNPFGEYGSRYEWSFAPTDLSFSGVNTTALSYDGIKAVSPGNMIWRFRAYIQGDYWVFYGLGGVKAFDLFGALRDRLSASFMGRIEAFFRHAYGIQAKK